jgi:hypothetical protein
VENKLNDRALWVALSYAFTDTEIDYSRLMTVAKHYSVDEVEFALFERVAPVCVGNMLTPAPSIWWYFDEGELVCDIELLVARRTAQGLSGKCLSTLSGWFIRLYCSRLWKKIQCELVKAQKAPLNGIE